MRNLKRVLSLALAATMLMGMMVMGASAADYNDNDSVSYKEAVDVTTAIGVFGGDNNGNFMPTETLTRESAAKVITYLILGKSEADTLTTAAAPFKDVAANRWSAGSIAYCVSRGILAGDGQGNFFPEAKVTGSQFAKMLLVTLGYDAQTEGFVGNGWEMKVATVSNRPGVRLTRSLNIALSAPLSRERSAQMVLNTLQALTVHYEGGTNVTTPDGTTIISGGVVKQDASFMSTYYPKLDKGVTAANSANYYRPSYTWKNGVTVVGTYGAEPVVTYDNKVKADVVNSDLSGYTYSGATLYLDGTTSGAAHSTGADINALSQAGRVIEFYEGATSGVINQIVMIDTYAYEISNVNTVSKEVTLKQPGELVKVTEAASKDMYNKLVAFGKDAIVLVNFNGSITVGSRDNLVKDAEKPEVVTGTYTKKTADGEYIVGGTTYDLSSKAAASSVAMDLNNDYDVYLDRSGNIIHVAAVEDSATKAKTGYIVNTDVLGSASTGGSNYKALVLLTDGTQEWVNVLKVDNAKPNQTSSAFNALLNGKFVSYVVKSTGYEFTTLTNSSGAVGINSASDASYDVSGATITKNAVNFFTVDTDVTATKGNDKTVFLVGNSSDDSYKVYTGVKNIPGWTNVNGKVLIAKGTDVASVVVIYGSAQTADASDLVYLTTGNYAESYDTKAETPVYTYKAIKDGQVTEISTTTKVDASNNALAAGIYAIQQYDGDYASKLGAAPVDPANTAGLKVVYSGSITVKNGVVTAGSNSYVTANDVNIIAVKSSNGNAGAVTASDVEFYTVTSATLLKDSTGFITDIIFTY